MRKPLVAALLFISGLAVQGLGGCGGAVPGTTTSSGTLKTIGASGGTVTTSDGASIVFGAGAVSNDTTITITENSDAPIPAHATAVGVPYVFGPEGSQFAHPVTLTLPFSVASLPAGKTAADIAIYTAPVGSTTFTRLATTVEGAHASATTLHFSVFVTVVMDDAIDAGVGCTADVDCPSDDVCVGATCVELRTGADGGDGLDAGDAAACSTDSDCPSAEVCEAGACVIRSFDAGPADAAFGIDASDSGDATICAANQVACDLTCVDVASDPLNCGACGSVCPAATTCVRAVCMD